MDALIKDGWLEVSAVRMRSAVVAAIETDVIAVFKAPHDDGVAMGGVLLGRFEAEDRKFQIDGYEPATAVSETRRGAIGLYRSHARPGLQTDEDDAAMMRRCFPTGAAVLLLIKPLSARQCVGAFFRCADGVILEPGTSADEFPFAAPLPSNESDATADEPVRRRGRGDRWLIPSAIAVGLVAALFVHYNAAGSDENPVSVQSNPINSSSDTQPPKPPGHSDASAPAGVPEPAGTIKRFVNGVTTKASHLWPAHKANQEQQTP